MMGSSRTVSLTLPRDAGLAKVAGMAACAMAAQMRFTYLEVKEIQQAVRLVCANIAGRLQGKASAHVIVDLTADPTGLVVQAVGNGQLVPNGDSAFGDMLDLELAVSDVRELMHVVAVKHDDKRGACVTMAKCLGRT